MTMITGNEEGKNEKPISMEEQMFKTITRMQKELDELKKSQTPQQIIPSNGINADEFAKIIKAVTDGVKKDPNFDEGVEEAQIPIDDFDEKGVRFCSPSGGYILVDDIRKGHRVKLPYNKKFIYFEHNGTRRIQQGKYEALAPYAVYRSHSKVEIKWIRDHSLYNIMFYETSTEAAHADAAKATRIARIMNVIKNFEHIDVIRRCKEYQVIPNDDPQITRANLAFAMMDAELASEKSQTSAILNETFKEKLIVGKA